MSVHDESAVDFGDMQALLRFGYSRMEEARFLLLEIADPEAARDWLKQAPVNTAILREAPPQTVLQIAFTAQGLARLGLDAAVIDGFSDEFVSGMAGDENRARRLGDVGENGVQDWRWGGPATGEPDLLVLLYGREGALESWWRQLAGEAFGRAFQPPVELPRPICASREPFGFEDGISQPEIDWWQEVRRDSHGRDRYSNFLALGELALGYRNEYGLYTGRPLLAPGGAADALPEAQEQPGLRDLGCNGSYLVLRQLEQDVSGFWRYLDRVSQAHPAERERLAAALVGRERDGTPLVPAASINQFDFDDDPHGHQCPVGAHVRRANPRSGDFPPGVTGPISRLLRILGFKRRHPRDDLVASSRFHRLVRRGRVYGEPLSLEQSLAGVGDGSERGLLFACLGANISRQFEFVQSAWSMSSKFAGLEGESDPLLGNREPLSSGGPTDGFSMPRPDAPARRLQGLPRFVRVRGGAYFFLPGIRALRYIAGGG